MKKYYIICSLSVLGLASCTKDISSFNEQTKLAAQVPAATLFTNGVRNLSDVLASPNVNRNVSRLIVQQWATTTYPDEPNYDFTTRNIPQTFWTILYRDVIANVKESKRLIPNDITITEDVKKNRLAIADIMEVYTYSILVNTFGDVPYNEAIDASVTFPKYDDAKTIYEDLLKRVDADIAALNTSAAGFTAVQDIVYGGNITKWKKFANALKIRLAMTYADVDAAKAKTAFEQADAGAFAASADNASITYFSATPNNNPIWADLIQSKRQDYVAGETILNKMNALSDPRVPQYFKPNDAGVYVGGKAGALNTYSLFAKPGAKLEDPALPALLLSYDEIEFYRAEAKERGFTVTGSAEEHYNNAIKASIVYWGGTTAQADAYLLQPGVSYLTATGDWKEKIGTQKWIAFYNRTIDTWTDVRRLDYPKLPAPAAARSGFPNRLTYPTNEQTLNGANYTSAAAKIGGDKVETKIFWDKF
ncbi:SusD/RagB family nutrient-binding outer membrane lipoprotein [Flavisolibacter tropicus]|uniref:SusD/RagB family nutrient-binding outer membrane lipoprotein n=1 Tax=Flavisolibacter tropicus TaxID=1492898 RepID=A0A172TZV2_9BACT|nr:SusD/RagB family nutrient-binding outer membrane lipoprotein [Flavisolibacter tropicus]ANE52625.1 hypothetical protein SY85_21225 [Flavisolibacter tropicus]